MPGDIFSKEGAAITLEPAGTAITAGQEAVASVVMDCRTGGNCAEPFSGDFELLVGFAVAPANGEAIDLYLVPAIDGTDFAEVDLTNHKLQPDHYAGTFVVNKAQTAVQRLTCSGVPLRPRKFEVYLQNKTAENISAAWVLKVVVDRGQYS